MTCFCIGDVHGAATDLDRLLRRLDAIDSHAQLWFVGDLVNRGPDSPGVVRRVRALGDRAVTILGNHDLSLLAKRHMTIDNDKKKRDLDAFRAAPDAEQLFDWLRHRPLIHHASELGWTMVHAGIPADWSIDEAIERARELETALRAPDHDQLLSHLFGNTPGHWAPDLTGIERLRYIANALTRQRFVTDDGGLNMAYKKTVGGKPSGLVPWFTCRERATAAQRIVFGHWSALARLAWPEHNAWCIDTGAAWGGRLSALELNGKRPRVIRAD